MAQSPLQKFFSGKINWQESYASLILGGIIVVILGLLVANFLTRKTAQIGNGEQTVQSEEQAAKGQQHRVSAGESLSKIAQKYYGNQELWPVLARVNNIANPNIIFVDASLTIPAKNEAEEVRGQITTTSYQVQQGDTLFSIAEKVYGDGSRWPVLHRANGSRRLANGNPLVFAGSTIVIPR